MGNFYVSMAVRTEDRDALAAVLSGLPDKGVIAPADKDWTVFSTEALELQDERIIDQYGTALSRGGVPVLAVMNHDDDMLVLYLYQSGSRVAFANTDPGSLTGEDLSPAVENVEALASLSGGARADELIALLQADHVFAVEAHAELAALIGLPEISVGFGYRYFTNGEFGQDGFVTFGD